MTRLIHIALVIMASAVIAWFGEPLVRENTDFFLAIVTLFAVFAGFLVAVMSLGGDAIVGQSGSWAKLELSRDSAIARMNRARLLFYAYLAAASLILIVLAIQKSCYPVLMAALPIVNFLSLWFTTMGLLFSFALPTMLIGIQQSRIDREIERRRGESDASR